jgi:hypothetical protein
LRGELAEEKGVLAYTLHGLDEVVHEDETAGAGAGKGTRDLVWEALGACAESGTGAECAAGGCGRVEAERASVCGCVKCQGVVWVDVEVGLGVGVGTENGVWEVCDHGGCQVLKGVPFCGMLLLYFAEDFEGLGVAFAVGLVGIESRGLGVVGLSERGF